MATTVIAAQQGAEDTSLITIAAGVKATFHASAMRPGDSPIKVQAVDATGGFSNWRHRNEYGQTVDIELRYDNNIVQLTGPLEVRLAKPPTGYAVGVVSY